MEAIFVYIGAAYIASCMIKAAVWIADRIEAEAERAAEAAVIASFS